MPVEFISNGYDTTTTTPYTEVAWANAHPSIGLATYGVRSPGDWKVSAVSGQDRTVSIAAGRGFGYGVTDKAVANDTIQLDSILSGSRWDLVAVRRDWTPTAGVSKFVKVNGGATAVIPGGRQAGPGNIDDQPLALVQVTAGQTQPSSIIDLRTWSGDGGGLIANHDLVRSFLNATGTRISINGVNWARRVGANDAPEWFEEDSTGTWTPLTLGTGWVNNNGSTCEARLLDGGQLMHIRGDIRYLGNAGAVQESWVLANLPAGMRPNHTTFITGTHNGYDDAMIFYVTPTGLKVGPKPVGINYQFNGLAAMK